MTQPQHTPGPWFAVEADSMKYCSVVEFEYQSGARGTIGLVGSDGVTVGASNLDEQNANACLIAAAPDLLEALNGMLGLSHLVLTRDDIPEQLAEALGNNHRIEAAVAAIAKALGR